MTPMEWKWIWLTATAGVGVMGPFFQPGPVQADSIWDRNEHRYAYLFVDNRARRVGDLLTISVKESTGAKNNEERKLAKDTSTSGKFNFAGKTTGVGSKSAAADVSSNQTSDRKFQGSAEYESDRRLLDQTTVTVVDVLPNGNLVIEGFRERVITNETRLLRISGIVRPNDIGIGNIVESRFIANLKISLDGAGAETHFTNQGWLGRRVNKIWPH
ncbi:MAG: flagellar basal body L-ring protein FlgH [Planctomycetes bacterium]|nr:flagellar basal body L-ring protein FlgH [Planctomycetota bacterium]